METCLMVEWDNPKDEKRLEGYWKQAEKALPYFEKVKKEGIIKHYSFWSDNTGHTVFLIFFEDENKFAKLWGDKEYHEVARVAAKYFDNTQVRLMRPGTTSPD
ncbi:MAG: hypothetical protein ACFFD3_17615 [Candidatus Thorarchaeota archaeon]